MGRPVGRVAVGKATVCGVGVSQERGVALAQETYCLKALPEADHRSSHVPVSLLPASEPWGLTRVTQRTSPQSPALAACPWAFKIEQEWGTTFQKLLKTEFSNGRQI